MQFCKTLPSAIFILCCLLTGNLLAQSTVSGALIDPETNEALIGGYIKLFTLADSATYLGVADYEGKFSIDVDKDGDYDLIISYIGYETLQRKVTVDGDTDLGPIGLEVGSTALNEIEVTAVQERVNQRGDTTQYNAAAYGANPNAAAEDLLQKMPGFVVTDGKMQVQGENVTRILVNGKPFFGDDPDMALKNLPAEVIAKIEVYNQSDEDAEEEGAAGGSDGPKTINIVLKEEFKNGTFGNVYGGYGYADKYKAGANVNVLKGAQKLNILGQFNNINQQNFSSADLLGVTSKTGKNKRGAGNSNDFLVPRRGGINTTNAGGINYQNFWGKKTELSASYFFNQSENVNLISSFQDFYNTNHPYSIEETTIDNSENLNHRINAIFRHKINDKNNLLIRPKLTIQKNIGTSEGRTETFSDNLLTNTLNDLFNSDLHAINFSNRLVYTHRFDKKRRSLNIHFNNTNSLSDGQTLTNATTINSAQPDTLILRQNALLDRAKNNYSTGLRWSEPLGKRGVISTGYTYGNEQNESEILTYNFNDLNNIYDELNEDLSSLFNTDYYAHRGQLIYRYRSKKAIWKIQGDYQSAQLSSQQTFPENATVDKIYKNFLPSVSLRLNLSKTKNLRLSLKTRTQLPKITDLQAVVDNSNPLRIKAGNSDLDQQINYTFDAKYSSNNAQKGTVFFALLKTNFIKNYIGRNLIIAIEPDTIQGVVLPQGAQFRAPINLAGYLNTRFFITYGVPLKSLKSNFNINFGANHRRIPNQRDGVTLFTNTEKLTSDLVLSSNISPELDFTLKTTSTFDFAQSDISDNTQIFSQRTQAKINYIFAERWQINSNITHRYYQTFDTEPIDDFILWNAGLGYKFLENKQAEISLTLHDILNSNTAIRQTYGGDAFTQRQSLALTRYFMLNFRYNIRKFGE